MFTKKFHGPKGGQTFDHEKSLINRQFQYKTLGELVAMARATGVAPVPTRNGVYTGDQDIPRDEFERINAHRKLMDAFDDAEKQLAKIQSDEKAAAEERKSAEIAQKAIADYKASLKPSQTE